MASLKNLLLTLFIISLSFTAMQAQIPGSDAAGHWDIIIQTPDGPEPAWLEIETSGNHALVGRYVGPVGSARPIAEIHYNTDTDIYSFTIPPQWMDYAKDPHFEFALEDGKLKGWTRSLSGKKLSWTGVQAPALNQDEKPEWGKPIELLDAELSKWMIPEDGHFVMKDGVLINTKPGGKNLITKREFTDFKLHVEFRYPEGSNSGIYLRGRYEVQVLDSYGMKPDSHRLGGIYGFIAPVVNAAKKAGQWQTYDITLVGRNVTVVLNGTTVICNRPIPGITGGALNSHEGQPGPIMLQGNHGRVQFRNITITPVVK